MPGACSGRCQRCRGSRSSSSTGTNRGSFVFFPMRTSYWTRYMIARARQRFHSEEKNMRRFRIAWLAPAIAASLAAAQPSTTPEKSNMDLVGSHDLQARSAYQPVIQHQGERWIAYIGHHGGKAMNALTGAVEYNGTSILDVTDPRRPRLL